MNKDWYKIGRCRCRLCYSFVSCYNMKTASKDWHHQTMKHKTARTASNKATIILILGRGPCFASTKTRPWTRSDNAVFFNTRIHSGDFSVRCARLSLVFCVVSYSRRINLWTCHACIGEEGKYDD